MGEWGEWGAFVVGIYVGAELGYWWGKKWMFNEIKRLVKENHLSKLKKHD